MYAGKRTDKRSNPKEQRLPKHGRQHPQTHPISEKAVGGTQTIQKVKSKPEYESPGPEFYNNLKRETDEILKITEEENSKYKKKEIQSNWSKYELPIDSYEEIEEQENMGADYEKLIQSPLVVGGHFQFKHEKSWNLNTAPSLYEKYFEFNMDNLNLAISTIPFYDRNSIDRSIFSETDILSMNNRATRFKQKYYNDNTYSTPEMEASNKILQSLSDNNEGAVPAQDDSDHDNVTNIANTIQISTNISIPMIEAESKIEPQTSFKSDKVDTLVNNESLKTLSLKNTTENDDPIMEKLNLKIITPKEKTDIVKTNLLDHEIDVLDNKVNDFVFGQVDKDLSTNNLVPVEEHKKVLKDTETEKEMKNSAVIESPEELEKWLDDFLDS